MMYGNLSLPPLVSRGQDLYFCLNETISERDGLDHILKKAAERNKDSLIYNVALELSDLDRQEETPNDNHMRICENKERERMRILGGLER